MIQYEIIKRPLNTEKTNIQKEALNQVSFEIDRRANRIEVKRAVEIRSELPGSIPCKSEGKPSAGDAISASAGIGKKQLSL